MSSIAPQPRLPLRGEWRQHPMSFIGSTILGAVALVVGIAFNSTVFEIGTNALTPSGARGTTIGGWILVVILWLLVIAFVGPALSNLKAALFTVWWLDEEKVNEVYSFIRRDQGSQSFLRIDEVSIQQGFIARLFGYGTIRITPRGKDGDFYIPNAPNAAELHEFFSKIASNNRRRFNQADS